MPTEEVHTCISEVTGLAHMNTDHSSDTFISVVTRWYGPSEHNRRLHLPYVSALSRIGLAEISTDHTRHLKPSESTRNNKTVTLAMTIP